MVLYPLLKQQNLNVKKKHNFALCVDRKSTSLPSPPSSLLILILLWSWDLCMPSFCVLKTQHTRPPSLSASSSTSTSVRQAFNYVFQQKSILSPATQTKWAEPIAVSLVLGGHAGLQLSTGSTVRSDKMQELPLYVSRSSREHAFSVHMIQRQLNSRVWERNFKIERP